MKRNYLFLPLLLLMFSCSEIKKQLEEDLKQQLVDKLKIEFVKTFPNPTVSVDEKGNVFIKQDEMSVSIDKDKIFIGDLDNDDETDIAYTILLSSGGNTEEAMHMVVLTESKQEMNFKLEYNCAITGINNKKIMVTAFEYADDDPRCCPSLKSYKSYSFIGNKIVEVN